MTHYETFDGWPVKVHTTSIRCATDSEPATYNSYAYCLCNADGSAGTYADLKRCGADCGSKKSPVSVQAQGRTPEESLERVRAKYPRLMTKLHPLLCASIRDSGRLIAAFETYCKDDRLSAKAQSFLRGRLMPALGNTRIADITPAVLFITVRQIVSEDDANHTAKEEINRHIRYAEQLFALLQRDNCYTADNDPTVDLTQLKRYTKKSRAAGSNRNRTRLTDEERKRLTTWCADHPDRVAAAVALIYNGLSSSEISVLNLSDLETLSCGIHSLWIAKRLLRNGAKYTAQPVAVSQIRRLPLFAATEKALCAYAETLCDPADERPLVGMGPNGDRRYTPDLIRKDLAAVLGELSIYPDAVCADHTSIRPEQAESLLMHDAEFCLSDRARMPVEYRAMLCGRPQPTTNGRHYIDLDCDDTQIAVYRMAQRMVSVSGASSAYQAVLDAQHPTCTADGETGRYVRADLRPDRPCRVEIVSPFGFSVLTK